MLQHSERSSMHMAGAIFHGQSDKLCHKSDGDHGCYEHQNTIRASQPMVSPHNTQRRALPTFEAFVHADSPLIMTGDPRVSSQVISGSSDPSVQVPLDCPVPLQTKYFDGYCMLQLKGLGHSEAGFKGNRWLGRTVIQGKFKHGLPADDLWVGQELWNKPLLPSSFQRLIFTTAAKLFSSTCRVASDCEGAGYLNPLMAMAQVVNVSEEGQQPRMDRVHEDVRLMSSKLADKKGRPLSSAQRQKFCDKPANLASLYVNDTYVYTFVVQQGVMDLSKYQLSLGGMLNLNLDLAHLLNGQPLSLLCKSIRDNTPIMSLLIWHKRLNYPDGCYQEAFDSSSTDSRDTVRSSDSSSVSSSSLTPSICGSSSLLTSVDCTSSSSSTCGSSSDLGSSENVCCSSLAACLPHSASTTCLINLNSDSSSDSSINITKKEAIEQQQEQEQDCEYSEYNSVCSDAFPVWSDGDDLKSAACLFDSNWQAAELYVESSPPLSITAAAEAAGEPTETPGPSVTHDQPIWPQQQLQKQKKLRASAKALTARLKAAVKRRIQRYSSSSSSSSVR